MVFSMLLFIIWKKVKDDIAPIITANVHPHVTWFLISWGGEDDINSNITGGLHPLRYFS